MAGFVPNEFRAALLNALAGRVGIAATEDVDGSGLYLGLAHTVPDDPNTTTLSNLTEVATAGYARVEVPFFDPSSTSAPVRITTPTRFEFPELGADMAEGANYAFLTDAATGTAGVVRYVWPLASPLYGRFGEPLVIPANTLVVE